MSRSTYYRLLSWAVAVLLLLPGIGFAQKHLNHNDISVEITDDRGRVFKQYPVRSDSASYRAYLEADEGEPYSINVRNRSDRRIGLVIAVDGRNIISGQRSELSPDERMYILGPGESGSYSGWRTGRDQVNRFYFTTEGASYAGSWGDYSAMGVIAIAAYAEKPRRYRRADELTYSEGRSKSQKSAPGTGFGEEEYSPSRKVEFDPVNIAFARHFIKYEWHDALCEKGVIRCRQRQSDGYAPPPPNQPPTHTSYLPWQKRYAETAVAQQRQNLKYRCDYRGGRWSEDYDRHLDWATTVSKREANAETQIRKDMIYNCQRTRGDRHSRNDRHDQAEDYAQTAVDQQQQNLEYRCGYRGGRWHTDYQDHYEYALKAPPGELREEIRYRSRALERCR